MSAFDVGRLRMEARHDFVDVLKKIPGPKDLFIDPELMKPLNHVAGAAFIREQGVEKMYKLEGTSPAQATNSRIYLARSEIDRCRTLAAHIKKNNDPSWKTLVAFVPRKTAACETYLEEEGLYGRIQTTEWHLDLIPIDDDLLSLELKSFYRRVFVDRDQTWLHDVAFSLVKIQQLFGPISTFYAVGEMSKKIDRMFDVMTSGMKFFDSTGKSFDTVILVDRKCDLVTPLCSQVVYQGVVDDVFRVESGFVDFSDQAITGKTGTVTLQMNATSDPIFAEIRDRHFSSVSAHLGRRVRELDSSYKRGKGASSVDDMRSFVKELGGLKQQHRALALHIGACEAIGKRKSDENFERVLATEHALVENADERRCVDYIEEMIQRQVSAVTELRLLCLYSQTVGGLKSKVVDSFRRLFLHSHGYEHMLTFYNLKRAGLLLEGSSGATKAYSALKRKLQLVPRLSDQYDLNEPTDMGYVFSGAYTPISCRVVESVLRHLGWLGLEEVTRYMPGGVSARTAREGAAAGGGGGLKTVLVFFVGGCTYSEVSALRFLGSRMKIRFVIATTNVVRAESFISANFHNRK